MATGAQIVGRIGIRVVPDLTGFREELEAKLRAMRDVVLEVKVVPNLDGFVSRIQAAARAAEATTRVEIPVDVNTRGLRGVSQRIRDALFLRSLDPDIDLSDLTDFERLLLSTTVMTNRMYANLRRAAQAMRPFEGDARDSRFHFDGIRSAAGRIPPFLRNAASQSRSLRDVWANMGRLFTDSRDRVSEFRDSVRDAGGWGNRLRDAVSGISFDFGGVRPGDEFREATRQAAQAAKESSRIRQAWQGIARSSANIREMVRQYRELNKLQNYAPTVDRSAVSNPMGDRDLLRNLERISGFQARINGLRYLFRDIKNEIRRMDRDSIGVASSWDRLRTATAAAAKSFRDGARGAREMSTSTALAVRDLSPMPAIVRRTKTDRLYRGFVALGNGALEFGRRARNAFDGSGAAVRSLGRGLGNSVRSFGRLGSSFAGFARNSRVLGPLVRTTGSLTKGLFNLGKGLINPISGFMQLSRTGKIVVAVLALLPGILGLVGGLLAGLPSLLLAGAGGFAAIALGIDGIKAAAKSIQPEFDALRASVSATFEKGLRPVFESLRPIFPVLEQGINSIATGLVGWARGLAAIFTSQSGLEMLRGLLGNIGTFFREITPFITNSVGGFMTWASAGAASFGTLSRLLNKFGADWATLASRLVSDGTFAKAIEGLAQVVGVLFDNWLRLVEYGVGAMARLGPSMAAGFQGFFDLLFSLMPLLEGLFLAISFIVQGLAVGLGPALEVVGAAFTQWIQTIGPHFVTMMQQLSPVLLQIGQLFGQLVETLIGALGPVMPVITQMFGVLVQMIGTFLTQAIAMVMPLITQLVSFFTMLWQIIQPLIPPLLQLAMVIFQALITVLNALLPPFMQLVQAVLPILIDLVRLLVPFLVQIIGVLTETIPVAAQFAATLIGVVAGAMNFVLGVVQFVWPFIRTIIQGVLDVIMGIVNVFMGLLTGDWQRVWDGIVQILTGIVNILIGILVGLAAGIGEIFVGIYNWVTDFFSNAGSWLWEAGKAIIQGLWDGLKALWDQVQGWVTGIADWIVQNKGPISKDRRLLVPAGKAIMEGLYNGLRHSFGEVQTLVSGMADQLATPFEEPIDVTMTAGFDKTLSQLPTGVSGDIRSQIAADGFGLDSGAIASAVVAGLTGSTLKVDGNGVAKLVNKTNTRRDRRG
jgi:phage-related protein